MRKKLLLVCIVGLLSAPVFADHSERDVGLGLFVGGGWNTAGGGLFNPGFSLKVPGVPVFWGINGHISGTYAGLSVTADHYFFDRDLVKDGSIDLDWFFGAGIFSHLSFGDNAAFALGARLPIGLSWHITNFFELFFDVTPGIGIRFTSDPFYFTGGAELGLRFWL